MQGLSCLPASCYVKEQQRVVLTLSEVCRLRKTKEKDDPESRKYGAKVIHDVI